MKQKAIIFHPAIAPYRVDFFNSLNNAFEAEFYFEFHNALEQSFQQDALIDRLHFTPRYLKKGLFGIKNMRWQIFEILHSAKPDIVICSEYNLTTILILLHKWFFQRKMKVITLCDDSCGTEATEGTVKKWSRRLLVKWLDGIVLANTAIFKWYHTHLKTHAKLLYFPIIQADDEFRIRLNQAIPIARRILLEQVGTGKQVLLFVGRLAQVKNLSILLEAFSHIRQDYPETVLILVGEGSEADSLRSIVRASGMEKQVLFAGKVEGLELLAYYNVGQVFILPSYYEPFGAVVNEALLAGCYTLCSSSAGSASLIQEGINGELFDPYRTTDLEEKLRIALSQTAPLQEVKVKSNRMQISYSQYIHNLLREL